MYVSNYTDLFEDFKLFFACQNLLFTGYTRGTESKTMDGKSNAVNDGCESKEEMSKEH